MTPQDCMAHCLYENICIQNDRRTQELYRRKAEDISRTTDRHRQSAPAQREWQRGFGWPQCAGNTTQTPCTPGHSRAIQQPRPLSLSLSLGGIVVTNANENVLVKTCVRSVPFQSSGNIHTFRLSYTVSIQPVYSKNYCQQSQLVQGRYPKLWPPVAYTVYYSERCFKKGRLSTVILYVGSLLFRSCC